MRLAAIALASTVTACAHVDGDVLEQRQAARTTRDAGYVMSLVGASTTAAAVAAAWVAPNDVQPTALIAAAPIAALGVLAYGSGAVIARIGEAELK